MAIQQPRYVSVFKIDGIPILPPLMTTEKRREMLMYREKAVQLQQRKQKHKPEQSCNLLRHGHSHIPQPQTPRKQYVESGNGDSKRDRIDKLRQTDTIVYDNRVNSIILTLEGFEEETDFQSMEIERPQHNLDQNDNKIPSDVPKSPVKSDNETTKDDNESTNQTRSKPQPYAAFIPIPSICVNPPTPCVPYNPIVCNSPPKRLCSSPTLKPRSACGLIRSNSFTLDGPSSALLEHIKNQQLKKSTATQDTIESKAKRVQKVETKPKAKSPKSPSAVNLSYFPSNTSLFKAKRSPYEMKSSSKAKLAKFHKFSKPNATKKTSTAGSGDYVVKKQLSPTKSTSKLDVLKNIEEDHRAKFLELVRQQQTEQKRLQEQFEMQQKLLLEQLSAQMAKVQMQSSPSSTVESTQSSPSPSPEQDTNQSTHITPRRRLFPELMITGPSPNNHGEHDSSPSPQSISARRFEAIKLRRYWAATKINALARGFLTRRLFRTDYVQRIVQTIKDTLIFALNLHFEERDDHSEASVKLKARLLQQLTTASRTLHAVFIETTVKDRMEIIARDRKYLQAKQLSKRSPRILR